MILMQFVVENFELLICYKFETSFEIFVTEQKCEEA